ncbi:MAG: hypothetical protein K2N36_04930 [Ruminiclostridium sp.]|nr:hypothetical protein [Ruminiclostridium sp.]
MIFKKIVAVFTATAMAVTSLATFASAEMNYPYTADLIFFDKNWNGDYYSIIRTSISIPSSGTYTMSFGFYDDENQPIVANGIKFFFIDIRDLAKDLVLEAIASGEKLEDLCTFSDVKIIADGKEIAVDQDKLVWGSLNETDDFRLEIYNIYAPYKDDSAVNPNDIVDVKQISVTFTITIGKNESDVTESEKPEDPGNENPENPGDGSLKPVNPDVGDGKPTIGDGTENPANTDNGTAAPAGSDNGNTPGTGIVIAVVPMITAACALVIFKKRK